jgi:glycosyltransferase involved in cell wall biosynthesis
VHRNFQTRNAELQDEVRLVRLKHRTLVDQLRAAPEDPLEWILQTQVSAPPVLRFHRRIEPGLCTVILPVFNNIEFVDRAVESVWKQELPPERIELIAVDDGSTDGSLDRLRALAEKSPVRMEVLTHPGRTNRGVAPTRNLGFQHAGGEFIALLDADDRYLPERLSASLEYFVAHPDCTSVCSFGLNVDETGNPTQGYNHSKIAGEYREVSPDLSPPFTFEQLWKDYPIANSTITMRREALERTGGYPEVMAHQSEDWYLMLLFSIENPVPCIERPLIEYTRHLDSYTELYRERGLAQGARFEVLMYLVQWMIRRPEHREAGRMLYRRECPGLISHHETPNLSHLPLIARNAWKRFRKIGVGGSVRMLRASFREARRKRHG